MAEHGDAPPSPSPLPTPPEGAASGKRRRWPLWAAGSLLLASLLVTAVVVVARTASGLRDDASRIGGATLPVPSESYPGNVEVVVKRNGSCRVTSTNATQADVDLSCLKTEMTPTGEFGANFLAYSGEVRIGEGVTGDVVNGAARTAYGFSYALVTTDVAGHAGDAVASCADGACVLRSQVTLSSELHGGKVPTASAFDLGRGAMSVVKLGRNETVSVQAGQSNLSVSQGDLDNFRDHLFAVAYTGTTPEGASGPRLTLIGIHAFGNGDLEPEQFFAAIRAS